jgi:TonB family protein
MNTWHAPLNRTNPTHKVGLRLSGFVLVSMVLHLTFLLSQHASPEFGLQHDTIMQITIGTTNATTAEIHPQNDIAPTKNTARTSQPVVQKPRTAPAQKHLANEVIVTAANALLETAASHEPKPELPSSSLEQQNKNMTVPSTHATQAATTTEGADHTSQQRHTITQQLKQALAKHFYYPMIARKHGWQGIVLLAFDIDPSGTIIHARIAQGSGYGALNQAALKSLHKVAAINIEPSQTFSFELPVIYNLNGG